MSDLNERPVPHSPADLSSAALARRHMLLKTLGKGTAVAAAASIPMRTLANTPTLLTMDGTRCSISGMQSGNNSRMGTTISRCTGKSPGYWHKPEHWTSAQRLQAATPFGVLFLDPANALAKYTLFEFVCSIGNGAPDSTADKGNAGDKADKGKKQDNGELVAPVLPPGVKLNNTDEWHWCCAWMNATANHSAGSGVVDFPYTPTQVVAIYGNPTSFNTTRAQALEFFKKLEN